MRVIFAITGFAAMVLLVVVPTLGQAASGVPNSPGFGYGGRLDIDGQQIPQAINAAAGMGLDWVALEFDWAQRWPDPNAAPNLDTLSQAIGQAQGKQLNVLLSITHAPPWAMNAAGPDAVITANLVISLARLYTDGVKAIELFPSANTAHGWGAAASPPAYLTLLQSVDVMLKSENQQVFLVAAGLTPLGPQTNPGDMDDLQFLAELYRLGAAPLMPIVSIQLPELTGDPMQATSQSERRVLRHFEEVRQVMRAYNHKDGLIWITAFCWPHDDLSADDHTYASPDEQARWLSKAYKLLKAQLFIGAAFFSQVNPSRPDVSPQPPSLIQTDLSLHPAVSALSEVITPNGTTTFEIVFSKISNEKIVLKKVP